MPAKSSPKNEPWYVEERLHALAVVSLTRRNDLALMNPPEGSGLDFIVEIEKRGRPTGRRFGVQLLPLNGATRMREVPWVDSPTFPVCIFAFDVADERAGYAWPREPVVTEEGVAKLVEHTGQGYEELDRKALDRIVAQVNRWYDALLKNLAN
jgi:hypothetical protein